MLWHRIQRAEFFRASSATNRYISAPRPHGIRRAGPSFTSAKAAVGAAALSRGTSRPSSAKNTPLADQLSVASFQSTGVQPDEGIGISRSDPTTAPDQVVGNSGGLALRAKPKQRDNTPSNLDDGGVVPLHIDQSPTMGRTVWRCDHRASMHAHLRRESESSWGYMSSGMNSNPASAGSGEY